MTIRVLIVEDQGLILGALAQLLALESDIDVVGTAPNGKAGLDLARTLTPDVVVSDIEMPEMSGLELAATLKKEDLSARILIVTTFGRAGYLKRAMDAGVTGYLLKDAPSEQLAESIRKVARGQKVIAQSLLEDSWGAVDPLTEKEREVLKLAANGHSSKEIARMLTIAPGTVRNYLSEATQKLGATNRIEAARIAKQSGWL